MVPMLGYVMVGDMTPKQIGDCRNSPISAASIGVVPEKIDVTKVLRKF